MSSCVCVSDLFHSVNVWKHFFQGGRMNVVSRWVLLSSQKEEWVSHIYRFENEMQGGKWSIMLCKWGISDRFMEKEHYLSVLCLSPKSEIPLYKCSECGFVINLWQSCHPPPGEVMEKEVMELSLSELKQICISHLSPRICVIGIKHVWLHEGLSVLRKKHKDILMIHMNR